MFNNPTFFIACTLLVCINFQLAFSQNEEDKLVMQGLVEEHFLREPLTGVKVKMYHNSSQVAQIKTDEKGLFELNMELNKEYTIEFSRQDYVSKKIYVNSALPGDEGGTWQVEFSVGLFEMFPGLDISALDDPVTKIRYKDKEKGFGYDRNYTRKMMAKIDDILAQLKRLKEEAYRRLIRKGDHHFDRKEYKESIQFYQSALDQRPDDRYPGKQIERARELMKEKKERQTLYENAVARADSLFEEKKYRKAREVYYEALSYNRSKVYPNEQISKIDQILRELREEKLARKKKQENYEEYISKGDRYYKDEDYEQAKTNYQRALNLFPNKQYPADQIDRIKKKIEALARQKAENEKYDNLIAQADKAFSDKQYQSAASLYEEALAVKSGEKYPREQIGKIEDILKKQREKKSRYKKLIAQADQAFDEESYKAAKSDYREALQVQPGKEHPKKRIAQIGEILDKQQQTRAKYNQKISRADSAFDEGQFIDAKALYSEALFIKPNKRYPRDQIDKIDDKLAELKAQKEKEKKERYNTLITRADQAFENEEYEAAKSDYLEASKVRPKEDYPKDQVAEIEDILAQLRAKKKKREERNQKYEDAINTADQLFGLESYEDAKIAYNQALKIKPGETYPKEQIKEIEKLLHQQKEKKEKEKKNRLYAQEIDEADRLFRKNAYYDAQAHYKKALQYKPDEVYPKKRLKRIQEIWEEMNNNNKKQTASADQDNKKAEDNAPPAIEFENSDERETYLNDLAEKYPEGITVEKYELKKRVITRVIVNHDGIATDYRKVKHSWGKTFYFRNGQTISRAVFDVETRERNQ